MMCHLQLTWLDSEWPSLGSNLRVGQQTWAKPMRFFFKDFRGEKMLWLVWRLELESHRDESIVSTIASQTTCKLPSGRSRSYEEAEKLMWGERGKESRVRGKQRRSCERRRSCCLRSFLIPMKPLPPLSFILCPYSQSSWTWASICCFQSRKVLLTRAFSDYQGLKNYATLQSGIEKAAWSRPKLMNQIIRVWKIWIALWACHQAYYSVYH